MERNASQSGCSRMITLVMALLILPACLPVSNACAQTQLLSPTTGLPLTGQPTAPVMAVISYVEANTRLEGKKVSAPGVENCQPWGGSDADMVFETRLFQNGATRLVYLYHDALAEGRTVNAGPVRSVRDAHVKLASFWRAGLISRASHPYSAPGLDGWAGQLFDMAHPRRQEFFTYAEGRKGHDKMSVDVNAVHSLMDRSTSASGMWFFGTAEQLAALAAEGTPDSYFEEGIRIGWGEKGHTTVFRYEGSTGKYSWYANNVPMKNWRDVNFTEEAPMVFDNVVILHTAHSYPQSPLLPVVDIGEGRTGDAAVYTCGTVQHGCWIVRDGQLLLETTGGEALLLSPGKTYVALVPEEQ